MESAFDFNDQETYDPDDPFYRLESIGTGISNFIAQRCLPKNADTLSKMQFLDDLELVFRENVRGSYPTDGQFEKVMQNIGSCGSLCGKQIPKGELFFICDDCDLLRKEAGYVAFALQCKQCFGNSNHEGHKISKMISTGEAFCDCGDTEAWDKQGCCSTHKGFSSESATKMLLQIPEAAANSYLSTFSETFYLIFRIIEENDVNDFDIHTNLFLMVGEFLIDYCKKADAFKLLTAKLLTSTLNEKWLFRHNCDDLEELSYRKSKGYCKCTLLELLLRFSGYLKGDCQPTFKDLFVTLFGDNEFKKSLILTLIKMIHFSYGVESPITTYQRTNDNILLDPIWEVKGIKLSESQFNELLQQLLLSEDLAQIAVNGGNFRQFFGVLRKLLYFGGVKGKIQDVHTMFQSATDNLLRIFKQTEASHGVLQNSETIEAIFSLVMDIQNTDRLHFHEFLTLANVPRYDQYHISKADHANRILKLISLMMTHMFQIGDSSLKEKLISNFGVLLASYYKKYKESNKNSHPESITMNPALFHAFGVFISYLIVENPDLNFNDQEFQIMWEDALYESLKSLIFFKAISHVTQDIPDLQELSSTIKPAHDFHFCTNPSNYEVLVAQISFLMISDKKRVKSIMKSLFSYMAEEEDPDLEIVWKRTCFEVFTFVVKDESSYARILQDQIACRFKPAEKLKPLFDEIIKKVIVNYLHACPFQTLAKMEDGLKRFIQLEDSQYTPDSIVTINGLTNHVDLKEEWQNRGISPQIFYTATDLHQMHQLTLKKIGASNADFNMLTGCPEPRSLLYLEDIEKTACLWILSELAMLSEITLTLIERKMDVVGPLRFIAFFVEILEQMPKKELSRILDLSTYKILKETIENLAMKLKSEKELEDYFSPTAKLLKIITEQLEKKILPSSQTGTKVTVDEEKKFEGK